MFLNPDWTLESLEDGQYHRLGLAHPQQILSISLGKAQASVCFKSSSEDPNEQAVFRTTDVSL